ncbi:hypothetical protein ACJX0J_018967, partial [Zea mays]
VFLPSSDFGDECARYIRSHMRATYIKGSIYIEQCEQTNLQFKKNDVQQSIETEQINYVNNKKGTSRKL